MEEVDFVIQYKGEERHFQASLRKYGYTFRIQVKVEDIPVEFEPDEEGQFRAIIESQYGSGFHQIDSRLLQVIAEELQEALK